jgi:hypothetical protein
MIENEEEESTLVKVLIDDIATNPETCRFDADGIRILQAGLCDREVNRTIYS